MWISLILAVVCALTLTACGGKTGSDPTAKPADPTADNTITNPTAAPTEAATDAPTAAPTEVPPEATDAPTDVPPETPTEAATDTATEAPSDVPTEAPTETTAAAPTDAPTKAPTEAPTQAGNVYPVKEQTADNYTVSIIEFNVQTETDTTYPLEDRADVFRALMDELQPDVVGMQEVGPNWRELLDSTVFNDSYTGFGDARGDDGEANPIYYRVDKFEKLDGGTFWLSETPDEYGSKTEGANLPRICTWITLRDKTTGVEFTVLNTHLDHNGNNEAATGRQIRLQQMGYIIKAMQSMLDKPLFLTCDLNQRILNGKGNMYPIHKMIRGQQPYTDTDGTEYTVTLGDARVDAKETVPADRIACIVKYFDESSDSYDPANEPVDYVFYNPARAEALTYNTLLYSQDDTWISDHLPLVTTFRIITSGDTDLPFVG